MTRPWVPDSRRASRPTDAIVAVSSRTVPPWIRLAGGPGSCSHRSCRKITFFRPNLDFRAQPSRFFGCQSAGVGDQLFDLVIATPAKSVPKALFLAVWDTETRSRSDREPNLGLCTLDLGQWNRQKAVQGHHGKTRERSCARGFVLYQISARECEGYPLQPRASALFPGYPRGSLSGNPQWFPNHFGKQAPLARTPVVGYRRPLTRSPHGDGLIGPGVRQGHLARAVGASAVLTGRLVSWRLVFPLARTPLHDGPIRPRCSGGCRFPRPALSSYRIKALPPLLLGTPRCPTAASRPGGETRQLPLEEANEGGKGDASPQPGRLAHSLYIC